MSMEIKQVTPDAVAEMQQDYLATLTGPQDAYWQEGLIASADHMEIRVGDRPAGYFVQDADNQLMQFHLSSDFQRDAGEIFRQIIDERSIKTALAATIEPFYFSLCLDINVEAKVHTLLFSDHVKREPALESISGHVFRPANDDDLAKVLSLFTGGDEFVDLDTIEAQFEGPMGYAKMVIEAGILNVLEKDGEILGTAEFRERKSWVPYADVGMIVNKNYRRQGIGTFLLCLLKQKAYDQGLKPICSCEAGNVGSQKAIENAGFIADNRVVRFSF
jgi:RimJ/RimL family protein N-acetyltransferase